MSAWLKVGLPLSAVGAVALVGGIVSTSTITACSSSSSSSSSSGGGSSSGVSQCPANLTAGTVPDPTCVLADESTCGTPTTCSINQTVCGSDTTCEPLAENNGQTNWNFRIRALDVVAPSSLTGLVQTVVVDPGIELNLPECGESGGLGSFTWLIQFNPATGMLKTGGAPYSGDPLGVGYCFVNTTVTAPAGDLVVQPVNVQMTKNADGTYDSAIITAPLNIPIYNIVLNSDGGLAGNPGTPIVLPISGGRIKGVNFTNNGDCIGKFDSTALNAQCIETASCAKWQTAGALGGYITMAQADLVQIPQLGNKSLCVALTQQAGNNLTCNKNAAGAYTAQGDYCSTTGTAGGCGDSFWLAATFAASAIKINDGSSDPDCAGGAEDAGVDSATGTDSGPGTGTPDAGEDSGSANDASPE